jgi:hypothetical protein
MEADNDVADKTAKEARTTTNCPVNGVTAGPDSLVGAEIFLPHGDWNEIARVMGRKRTVTAYSLVELIEIRCSIRGSSLSSSPMAINRISSK